MYLNLTCYTAHQLGSKKVKVSKSDDRQRTLNVYAKKKQLPVLHHQSVIRNQVPAVCTMWKWRHTGVWGSKGSEVWCTNNEVHLKCWDGPQVKCHAVCTKRNCKINNFSFILVAVVYIITVRCEQLSYAQQHTMNMQRVTYLIQMCWGRQKNLNFLICFCCLSMKFHCNKYNILVHKNSLYRYFTVAIPTNCVIIWCRAAW
jgi:hypothetical protein